MFEAIKLLVGVISLIMVYRTITGNCNKYLAFAICAIWLRYFLSAFHTITYPPLIAGFSINALGSIGVAGLGLLLIPTAVFTLKKLFPFYVFFIAIAVSGFVNMQIPGTINVLVKWCYFLVLAGALFLSIRSQGQNETFKKLLVAFTMPVALQIASVFLGHAKATEADGSTSYIGGYNHEAAFSMIIVSFIFVIGLTKRKTIRFRTSLFTLAVFLLVLVNYRTAILTILPIAGVFYFTLVEQRLKPSQKAPILTVVTMLFAMVFFALSLAMQERFADVGLMLSNLDLILKAPRYFSEAEQDIMSSRVYIWSQYIDAFLNADTLNQVFGFGPDSWKQRFTLYAHNTFVSNIYEYGYLGFYSFIGVIFFTLLEAFSMYQKDLAKIVGLSIVGFLIMNLATMPLWNIEGLIFFAIVVGTVFSSSKQVDSNKTIATSTRVIGKGQAVI
ncbi:O-antigen ligase family protein [Alteromonas stellipolaris]|uniref:O-antigen ligase family protein n=1 Tax=Alteromonas stellipolaris TaxID=233316 RepID=UPI002733D8CF|nr:O-antigen ligase family protein [Alteromonas stellipolaris]MDP2537242.1 O-antigen ligase family protein [Alteromonas stellipolaris]